MTTLPQPLAGLSPRGWMLRLAASRRFQSWAARMPLLRHKARAEGEALFGLVAGFVNSQVLMALVELRVLHLLQDRPLSPEELAVPCALTEERARVLLQAGAGLGLLSRRRDGRFLLSLRGASLLGVPGLEAMVRHHRALYADLADPVALFRGGRETELARFWPYVFGGQGDPEVSATYSGLMAESQVLVAEDTLRLVDLSGARRLMDVGGGTGAFLSAVGAAWPDLALDLFDLPVVLDAARQRLSGPLATRVTLHPGSFRSDPLPRGADAISLVRVLYDHADETVDRLLAAVFEALPPGGRIVISEPMSGGERPDPITDVYFAIYTMAMQTGRTRSAAEISRKLDSAGYVNLRIRWGFRPYITSVITAERPKN